MIELAVADLSERLGILQEEIAAITGQLVVWPDASLGCPEPGMFYAQVLTDGSLIVLEAGGVIYRYHAAAGDAGPFLCEMPG